MNALTMILGPQIHVYPMVSVWTTFFAMTVYALLAIQETDARLVSTVVQFILC